MVRRHDVVSMGLALASTAAVELTGMTREVLIALQRRERIEVRLATFGEAD